MNILVIAAHPDDEVLGCGGTIAKLSKQGHVISILIMGESREGYSGKETYRATKILGGKSLPIFALPDNKFDTVSLLEIIRDIESVIDLIKPDTIYTHSDIDLNVDHTLVYRAVLTATRPKKGQPVKRLYSFEVPSATDWSFKAFEPNTFVDIEDSIDRKISALRCYGEEPQPRPHPRSERAIRAQAILRGAMAGCELAEAFKLIREVP